MQRHKRWFDCGGRGVLAVIREFTWKLPVSRRDAPRTFSRRDAPGYRKEPALRRAPLRIHS